MKATPEQAERAHRFAHDLRNRLAAIHQMLQQFHEPVDAATTAQLIDFAEQQYFRAMRSTEEFLDDLGVERGVGPLKRSAIDLSTMVSRGILAMQHRFERKQQVVTTSIDEHLVIDGDPHWIEQLILALLSNASKFTPVEGRVDVRLSKESGRTVLRVIDSGVGLDAEDLAMIFTRYAWLKSRSTDGEAQGRSTLGRAHQWAKAHGGSLSASSKGPGQGSVFELRLPA
ncbi:MAG: HAMP domain-containing histidine kinase [Flavobacteriales bacterium]|nr:HAMP domain-containing histidine kinase [Flavobacteriales bacterium]